MEKRLVVASHAAVVAGNRAPYEALSFSVSFWIPSTWTDSYRDYRVVPSEFIRPLPVWGAGRPQRYLPLRIPRSRPDFLVIEEESFSLSAWRFSRWARRRHVPYAVQAAENMNRPLPRVARQLRRKVLRDAQLVIGRSPAALDRVREWGFTGDRALVVHGVEGSPRQAPRPARLVVGFVGRLVSAKGIEDVIELARQHPEWLFRVAGDGERASDLAAVANIECCGPLTAAQMGDFYDSVSIVIVPSRTTPTWTEQFGRVIVEAVYAGRPVVAYATGEIPWVSSTIGSATVDEGDLTGMAREISWWTSLDDDAWRRRLTDMQAAVTVHFSAAAAVAELRRALAL